MWRENTLRQTFLTPPSMKYFSVIPHEQPQSHDETGILCDDCTPSHTLDLHAETIDERQAGEDVYDVLSDGDDHWKTSVLHTDIPTRETEQRQRGRSAPYDDIKIGGGKGSHIGCRPYQPKHQPFHRDLEHDEQQGDAQANRH